MHDVRVHPSKARLAREDQLAWRFAAVAIDPAEGCRFIKAVENISGLGPGELHHLHVSMPAGTVRKGLNGIF